MGYWRDAYDVDAADADAAETADGLAPWIVNGPK
jgi:hypothetical protein